eukprot:Skav210099  [mRNA]  locus=scaffold1510:466173:473823:- [translate_table: standard]
MVGPCPSTLTTDLDDGDTAALKHMPPGITTWPFGVYGDGERETAMPSTELTWQLCPGRLSYGMAKNPVDYLAAVQRWAEGGVVLSLQTFFSCHKGVYMVWFTLIFFFCFLASVFRMVSKTDPTWEVVKWGIVEEDWYTRAMEPVETYLTMTLQFISWVLCLVLFMVILFIFTEVLKFVQRVPWRDR